MAGTRTALVFVALLGFQATVSQSALVGPLPLKNAKIAFEPQSKQLPRNPRMLTNSDVVTMSQNGLGDDVIIKAIRDRGGAFRTNSQALIALQQLGVSNRVMMEMQRHTTEDE